MNSELPPYADVLPTFDKPYLLRFRGGIGFVFLKPSSRLVIRKIAAQCVQHPKLMRRRGWILVRPKGDHWKRAVDLAMGGFISTALF